MRHAEKLVVNTGIRSFADGEAVIKIWREMQFSLDFLGVVSDIVVWKLIRTRGRGGGTRRLHATEQCV